MNKELNSGIYVSLRARCATCGKSIAEHAYCTACGRPRRCDEEAGWEVNEKSSAELRCPTCVFAETG